MGLNRGPLKLIHPLVGEWCVILTQVAKVQMPHVPPVAPWSEIQYGV